MTTTEPIQAVEVTPPKPKLPRRWVAVCNEISKHGASRTAYAFTSEAEARNASGDAETLYALPASDEAAKPVCSNCNGEGFIESPCMMCGLRAKKPVVSAIPTFEDFWDLYEAIWKKNGYEPFLASHLSPQRELLKSIHALVAERVVEQEPPPLDPIKAIVEILYYVILDMERETPLRKAVYREANERLSALKQSLETPK
jgi:hypothetical protein